MGITPPRALPPLPRGPARHCGRGAGGRTPGSYTLYLVSLLLGRSLPSPGVLLDTVVLSGTLVLSGVIPYMESVIGEGITNV